MCCSGHTSCDIDGRRRLEPVDVLHIGVILGIRVIVLALVVVLLVLGSEAVLAIVCVLVLFVVLLIVGVNVVRPHAVLEDVRVALGTLVRGADPLAAGTNAETETMKSKGTNAETETMKARAQTLKQKL